LSAGFAEALLGTAATLLAGFAGLLAGLAGGFPAGAGWLAAAAAPSPRSRPVLVVPPEQAARMSIAVSAAPGRKRSLKGLMFMK